MVDVSPIGAPTMTALRILRMILPLRVFGSLLTMAMAAGVAMGPGSDVFSEFLAQFV